MPKPIRLADLTPFESDLSPPWLDSFPGDLLARVRDLPLSDLLAELSAQANSRGLVTGRGHPLRFVPQGQLPDHQAYELFIAQTGGVPTRDNLHDRFNALIWLMAPLTKARLNRRQSDVIEVALRTADRGATRDAATIWDENLLVLCVPHQDATRVRALLDLRDWQALFLLHRQKWHCDWQVVPFGHALLEKLEHPFKSITAHTLVLPTPCQWPLIDQHLAGIAAGPLSTKLFSPLPVMGIPGWSPDNVEPEFYADTHVFRPSRFA